MAQPGEAPFHNPGEPADLDMAGPRCFRARSLCRLAVCGGVEFVDSGLVTKRVQSSVYFFPTEQAVAKIGGNAFDVPPVEWPVHDPAIGIDVEIKKRAGLR